MRDEPYYSVRTGKHPTGGRLDLDGLKRLFTSVFERLSDEGYFQEVVGFNCVDAGFVPGSAGADTEAFFFQHLKKRHLWPLPSRVGHFSEDDLFDVMELLYDVVSKGVDGYHHDWNNCGWHYETFDRSAGQVEYRAAINGILREYDCGYELTARGEIIAKAPLGLADLERAPAPPGDSQDVQQRVAAAVDRFRRRGATLEQRRDAVRDLADVLEFVRPQAKAVITKRDEGDIFELANGFGIRHHNDKQKTDYDKAVWLSWMFYYYLATIHAVTRLIERSDRTFSA
ncbi:MAG: hypothetical protein KKA32_01465 [Actinobacteria bacterium]|nr:hypothetical protein [Actinomycetota bacterium]